MTRSVEFSLLTTPTRRSDHDFAIDFPDHWQQGRGAFGGLIVATMWRAARACEPEADRTLRSLTAELVGPVQPGPATLRVEMLRRGNGVSTLAVRLEQGDELLAHAVVVLGRARLQRERWTRLPPPAPPPFAEVAPLPASPTNAAAFAQFFEFRPTGPLPFQGTPDLLPRTSGWVRLRAVADQLTAGELIALADAWWPCVLVPERTPRPAATLAFTFELLHDPAHLRPLAPVFHRAEAIAAQDGYSVELRELWSEDGELLALNQQTFALIK
jgi:acyl-CoA thioesterase